jgi:electron transfer flavoprotein beta subunit
VKEGYQIVVCSSVVPDPLQRLEPVNESGGPAVKNEAILPSVLDPWAAHALYEAAHLAESVPGSRVLLVAFAPKTKLQQVMMSVAQKVSFELIALDGSAGGFTDAWDVASALAETIRGIPDLDRSRLLVFGGWESASRGAGVTLQFVGEQLGIIDQFQGVDELIVGPDGSMLVLERVEGGKHQYSSCEGPPAVFGWATGNLREPPSNPKLGMANMQSIQSAIQKAVPVRLGVDKEAIETVELSGPKRITRIVDDASADEIATEIVEWIRTPPI